MGLFVFIVIVVIIILLVVNLNNSQPNSSRLIEPSRTFSQTNSNKYLFKEKPNRLSIDVRFEGSALTLKDAKYVVLDIETTGLPRYRDAKPEDLSNWPFVVQFSWAIFDTAENLIKQQTYIIKPRIPIPDDTVSIHHISTEIANQKGVDPVKAFAEFISDIEYAETIVAHNVDFDIPILEAEFLRNGFPKQFIGKNKICTMKSSANYCCIPNRDGRGYKYPKLTELFGYLFANNSNIGIPEAHDAETDTMMAAKCFFELKKRIDLKPIKGVKDHVPEKRPLIYDPDNVLIPRPEFERLSTKYCTDSYLIDRFEYYKKSIIKDWKRLYEPDPDKIGAYGMDRLGYIARFEYQQEELKDVVDKIKAFIPKK